MKINVYLLFLITLNLLAFNKLLNGQYIFISNENSDTIVVLDKIKKEIVKTIKTGGRPRDLKFNNDYSKLYVVVSEENHILEIDADNLKVLDEIATGDDPEIFDIDETWGTESDIMRLV